MVVLDRILPQAIINNYFFLGRDVTRKLYSVSDVTNMGSNSNAQHQNNQMNQTPGRPLRVLNFRKTASMDAIHTGSKGNVRSDPWIKDANLKQFQNGKFLWNQLHIISLPFLKL